LVHVVRRLYSSDADKGFTKRGEVRVLVVAYVYGTAAKVNVFIFVPATKVPVPSSYHACALT